jgi:hypothetical protein
MGRTSNAQSRVIHNEHKALVKESEWERLLEGLDMDGRIILK